MKYTPLQKSKNRRQEDYLPNHLKQSKTMRLLLISNSTNAGESYLDHPKIQIKEFLGTERLSCLFIPYAGVTIDFDDYSKRVRERFNEIGHDIESIRRWPHIPYC